MQKKLKNIRDITRGEHISDVFVVEGKQAVRQYAKGFMFTLRIYDGTGDMNVKFFGSREQAVVEKLYASLHPKEIVHVTGNASEFAGRLEITVNDPDGIRPLAAGDFDPADFVKKSERDIAEMEGELLGMIKSVQDEDLARLLGEVFIKDDDFRAMFVNMPASMNRHQNWVGGLVEHTLKVAKTVEFIHNLHPGMDRDLLIAGALIHDIGKVKELDVGASITYTTPGELLGHITIGFDMLQKKMEAAKTPEELRIKMLHIMLSHHGKYEFGSPKLPAFPEALAINYADDMDSKIADILEVVKNAKSTDEFVPHPDFKRVYTK